MYLPYHQVSSLIFSPEELLPDNGSALLDCQLSHSLLLTLSFASTLFVQRIISLEVLLTFLNPPHTSYADI